TFVHEVLEQVREPRAPLGFVDGPYVVPEVDGDPRQLSVLTQDHLQPVVELVGHEREQGAGLLGADLARRGWVSRGCGGARPRLNREPETQAQAGHKQTAEEARTPPWAAR